MSPSQFIVRAIVEIIGVYSISNLKQSTETSSCIILQNIQFTGLVFEYTYTTSHLYKLFLKLQPNLHISASVNSGYLYYEYRLHINSYYFEHSLHVNNDNM